MITQPLYVWYHIQCTCDIISTVFMTSYPLCVTSQHCVLMTPHSAYVWHHLPYRWYHIHSITPNHNIHDVASTSGMTSHPLYQTLHPLYLCYHNHSTDITPTFVWHQTHYICANICTICNIIFTPYVITLLYLWHHNLYIWNHIQYVGQHIHYTCDITATNLCYHTQIIDHITSLVCMISQPQYIWYHMNYIWHHIHSLWYHSTLWHHTHCIHVITPSIPDIASTVAVPLLTVYWLYHTYYMCSIKPTICMTKYEFYMISHPVFMTSQDCIHDITSTLFMTLHPLYMPSHPLYLWHHSHCIYDKTTTVFMTSYSVYTTSHMVYEWQHNHCVWHYTHCFCVITPTWLITPYVCLKLHPLHVWHHRHCIWHHIHSWWHHTFVCHGTHYVYDIISTIYDVTHIVCMTTQDLYLTWNPFYLPSHPLYMSSHPLYRRHHTNYVRNHRWHMYSIICTIQEIISTLYDNNP